MQNLIDAIPTPLYRGFYAMTDVWGEYWWVIAPAIAVVTAAIVYRKDA